MFVDSDVFSIFDVTIPTPSQIFVAGEIRQVGLTQLKDAERKKCYEKHTSVSHYSLLSNIIKFVHVFCGVRHKVAVETNQEGT